MTSLACASVMFGVFSRASLNIGCTEQSDAGQLDEAMPDKLALKI